MKIGEEGIELNVEVFVGEVEHLQYEETQINALGSGDQRVRHLKVVKHKG